MNSRATILARVRTALRNVDATEQPAWQPPITTPVSQSADELTELFAERCADYRAVVSHCTGDADGIARAVSDACARHNVRRLIVPADIDNGWVNAGVELCSDHQSLTSAEMESHDGVLTASALAIADTGTIVLDAGPGQGRRSLTLIPDLHICVVTTIVSGVPDAIAAIASSVSAGRPVTLISGPSATSDIELKRAEGVHGPRRLEVILAR